MFEDLLVVKKKEKCTVEHVGFPKKNIRDVSQCYNQIPEPPMMAGE